MCGLFGFALVDCPQIPGDLLERGQRALATLTHRGPDSLEYLVCGGVFLGHTRLSVVDLSRAGLQPMLDDEQMVAITVNGEIYNHREIRASMPDAKFRSHSDSEVVLHGYLAFGFADLLERMDGMYAGVILDMRASRLHFFRDRVGIKPLHLAQVTRHGRRMLVWASELKAIRSFVDDLQVDASALLDFAAQRCIPAPKTIYREVSKLTPATCATFRLTSGLLTESTYWTLPTEQTGGSIETLAADLRDAIAESVSEQLVADVPVGLFLSGGIDSSIVCRTAMDLGAPLTTYTIGFREASHDESGFARAVAQFLGSSHVEQILEPDTESDVLQLMGDWYNEPFGDLSALPTHKVCELARGGSVVALSGDGGDELFGGYVWYDRFQNWRRYNHLLHRDRCVDLPYHRPPRHMVDKLANRLALYCQFDPLHLYAALMSNLLSFELAQVREWLEIPSDYDCLWALRKHYKPELGPRRSLQYLDFHTWLPDDILTKVDRVSMAVSLEVRVPLLSKKLCELAFSLPESFVYLHGQLKGGLKYAYRDLLPREVLQRSKKGFSIPVDWWKDDLLEGHPGYVQLVLQRVRSLGWQALG